MTIPVVASSVKVPSLAIVNEVVPQTLVVVVARHTVESVRSGPPVAFAASALVPKIGAKSFVPQSMSETVPGFATGGGGARTVGVMVVLTVWPMVSVTWYFTAVAVPVNDGNGSNVTVPSVFTVYVPCKAIVSDV